MGKTFTTTTTDFPPTGLRERSPVRHPVRITDRSAAPTAASYANTAACVRPRNPGFTNTLLTCALIIDSAATSRSMISAPDSTPRDQHQHLRLPLGQAAVRSLQRGHDTRGLAIGAPRLAESTNIAASVRRTARDTSRSLTLLGLT
jgi:hypothetical protein